MNRKDFMEQMGALGYRLKDSWEVQRSLYVNFRPESYVPTYGGFYFCRTNEAVSTDKSALTSPQSNVPERRVASDT